MPVIIVAALGEGLVVELFVDGEASGGGAG